MKIGESEWVDVWRKGGERDMREFGSGEKKWWDGWGRLFCKFDTYLWFL